VSLVVSGKDLEGLGPSNLFPYTHMGSDGDLRANLVALKKYQEAGGRVMIEITEGARKGSIGELIIPGVNIDDLYGASYTGGLGRQMRRSKIAEWQIRFDDRKNTIKVERHSYEYKWKGVLRFDRQDTIWSYESKERPKEQLPELFDHFGVKLEVGQVVLFLTGRGTNQYVRLGKVTRWSAKGTIWAESMKTRSDHPANAEMTIQGSVNIFVLDGDVRSKAMMAKLKYA
jgi:hypothetical protein